jgi:two-component system response regulator HydG
MLRKDGHDVRTAASGKEALALLAEETFDVVVTDVRMGGVDGLDVLSRAKEADASLPVVLLTAYASQETAIEAVNRGAFYYLTKQAKNDEIKLVIRKALEHRKLQMENRLLRRELKIQYDTRKAIGRSPLMEEVYRLVHRVAACDSTVIIFGESGTGKELIAREIHFASGRADGPFVSINCGALPENLLESELFGHVKGSFTGAVRDKEGLFAVAEGGTFLLDEVGETTPVIQVKLLRVLQEREIIPVGGTRPISVNVRLVAATNADLEKKVHDGTFRADLFYRLNVIPIHIPPLRERNEDIPLLVDHFLRRFDPTGKKKIAPEAMEILLRYPWPGNVRELENIMERMVILHDKDLIAPDDVPPRIRTQGEGLAAPEIDLSSITLEELEKRHLLRVLERTGWQKRKASSILGINTSTLYRKLQRYGLEK